MKSEELIERLIAVLVIVLLVGGAFMVLAPFTAALIWGAILAYTTWGPYKNPGTTALRQHGISDRLSNFSGGND